MLGRAILALAALACLPPPALAQVPAVTTAEPGGRIAIAPQFDLVGLFHDGVAPAKQGDRWGLIDRDGTWHVAPVFEDMRGGSDGRFGARGVWGWGALDRDGNWWVPPEHEDIGRFQNGFAPVQIGGKWGYVRPNGRMERHFQFLEIAGREGDTIVARDDQGWAVFDPHYFEGRQALVIYDEVTDTVVPAIRAFPPAERRAVVRYPAGETLAFLPSPILAPPLGREDHGLFHSVKRMSDGFAPAAKQPGRWGFLHRDGTYHWEGRFEDARSFSEGFAPVKIDGLWGYIDGLGRVVVEPEWDAAFGFSEGFALVRKDGKRGFLRLDPDTGISLWIEPRFEDAFRMSEGFAPVKKGGLWGFVAADRLPPRDARTATTVLPSE
ncbi:MAG: WG repeat-containing protein [Pseudomonadota bacterium]